MAAGKETGKNREESKKSDDEANEEIENELVDYNICDDIFEDEYQ